MQLETIMLPVYGGVYSGYHYLGKCYEDTPRRKILKALQDEGWDVIFVDEYATSTQILQGQTTLCELGEQAVFFRSHEAHPADKFYSALQERIATADDEEGDDPDKPTWLVQEEALGELWNTPEEDEAWKDL